MIDKTINDVPLKKLTFQTGQTKWDGGSTIFVTCDNETSMCILLPREWIVTKFVYFVVVLVFFATIKGRKKVIDLCKSDYLSITVVHIIKLWRIQ